MKDPDIDTTRSKKVKKKIKKKEIECVNATKIECTDSGSTFHSFGKSKQKHPPQHDFSFDSSILMSPRAQFGAHFSQHSILLS